MVTIPAGLAADARLRLATAIASRPGPRVVVLDYGSGNLRSAQRALERIMEAGTRASPRTWN